MEKKIESFVPKSVIDLLDEMTLQRPIARETNTLSSGNKTKRRILDAALSLFIEARSEDFTLRNLAKKLGMRVGNLTYHFKTKPELLENLVRDQLANYAEDIHSCLQKYEKTPFDALERVVTLLVHDLRKPEIAFFPQLWAVSLYDPDAEKLMDKIHNCELQVISGLIGACRPDWSQHDCDSLALHTTATIEGLTIFISRNKRAKGIYLAPEEEIISALKRALAPLEN